jgi:2-amino-4-hydroxy-6-hydroxymethyldihydropteridine diphosphokinase
MSNRVVLGLGGNVGNVEFTLFKCIELIEQHLGKIELKSALYQTKAWGVEKQPDFINQVIVVKTNFSVQQCLVVCQTIEKELGRVRKEKWHKRTIDIDILFYNSAILKEKELTIPHPFIQDRNFVLIPLAEIIQNFIHPVLNKTVQQLKNDCVDELVVIKL